MFEKVNPCHPDKLADRIAGALVDMAYAKETDPRIAVEVLIGHGACHIIAETSVTLSDEAVTEAVHRIAGNLTVDYKEVPQDGHLADNQANGVRCGDNGIFKGVPVTDEQRSLSDLAHMLFARFGCDGKYILDGERLIICQSNAPTEELRERCPNAEINPLGDWTGGTDVDTGATNRKLGFRHRRRSARKRPLQSGCQRKHLCVSQSAGNRCACVSLLCHRRRSRGRKTVCGHCSDCTQIHRVRGRL